MAVESLECAAPLRRATSVARFSAQVFLLFFSVFSEADDGNSLRFSLEQGLPEFFFFFFPLEGWIPIFPCNFIGVYLIFNFMLVLGVQPSESVIHICTLDSFPV